MDNNQKKFNFYVFFTTFARNLIEVFIPVILYNFGYTLREVIIYYLFVNIFSLMLTFFCGHIIEKWGYKNLKFAAIVCFVLMQLVLNNIIYSFLYLLIVAFLYAAYRKFYWLPRRYYNLNVVKKKNVSITYSIISVVNQLGIVISTYIGSLLLDFTNIKFVTIISVILFVVGILPLGEIKIENKNEKFELLETLKKIPFRNLYLFGTYESVNVLKFLFSLYLIIYVKNSYTTIGFYSLMSNFSLMVFTYMYGKFINKEKNFLNLSIFLTCLISLIKASVTSWLLIPVSFFESIFKKMYEISINKEFYSSGKNYDYNNYNFAYEVVQNITRLFIVLILVFIDDLKFMIYIVIFVIFIGCFIRFKNDDN